MGGIPACPRQSYHSGKFLSDLHSGYHPRGQPAGSEGSSANAGSMNHSFLHLRDVMPTILDLAEIDQPGQRFLMVEKCEPEVANTKLVFVENWGEELKALVPVD